jgi:hypothetical protein
LSTLLIAAGILLLAIMPSALLFFAITSTKDPHIPGTLVILSSAGGMALIVIGAALRA